MTVGAKLSAAAVANEIFVERQRKSNNFYT